MPAAVVETLGSFLQEVAHTAELGDGTQDAVMLDLGVQSFRCLRNACADCSRNQAMCRSVKTSVLIVILWYFHFHMKQLNDWKTQTITGGRGVSDLLSKH